MLVRHPVLEAIRPSPSVCRTQPTSETLASRQLTVESVSVNCIHQTSEVLETSTQKEKGRPAKGQPFQSNLPQVWNLREVAALTLSSSTAGAAVGEVERWYTAQACGDA